MENCNSIEKEKKIHSKNFAIFFLSDEHLQICKKSKVEKKIEWEKDKKTKKIKAVETG